MQDWVWMVVNSFKEGLIPPALTEMVVLLKGSSVGPTKLDIAWSNKAFSFQSSSLSEDCVESCCMAALEEFGRRGLARSLSGEVQAGSWNWGHWSHKWITFGGVTWRKRIHPWCLSSIWCHQSLYPSGPALGVGVSGTMLCWFFLSPDWFQLVLIGRERERSRQRPLLYGMAEGSVPIPLPFNIYKRLLGEMIQLYISASGTQSDAVDILSQRLKTVGMRQNGL